MAQEPETTAKRAELPMRLTRLRVKNFRSIADIDIPLSPLTVLVGPNGSGKSNVVDALRFVRDVFARGLDQAVMDREGMGVIQRWGTEGITVELTMRLVRRKGGYAFRDDDEYLQQDVFDYPISDASYGFTVGTSNINANEIKSEFIRVEVENSESKSFSLLKDKTGLKEKIGDEVWATLRDASDSPNTFSISENELLFPAGLFEKSKQNTGLLNRNLGLAYNVSITNAIQSFSEQIQSLLFYDLNPVDFRQPQQILKELPFDEKGRNLAAVLRRLSRLGSEKWNNLRFSLYQNVAGFKTLEVESVGGYLATKIIYQTDDPDHPRASYLGQESDGTIRMLGLLAALYQEPSQPFISIEEPEANIHPGALAILAGVIDEASLRSQVVVTTHSPDMLDHLPVESFLVVEKIGDTTHVGPLDASQIASVRKRLFTPGELFRMEGLQRQTESAS